MVTRLAERLAEAPVVGALKVTRPRVTGSPKGLAMVRTKGAGKGEKGGVVWLSPEATVSVKPRDSKAPMSGAEPRGRGMPRWSVVTPATGVPASMAGLPGSRAMVIVG